ncbi:MAG: DUF4340 domain-containing protein [Parvularculaceae bacterium]
MQRLLIGLSVLLLIQAGLAGLLLTTSGSDGAFEAREPLLAFDVDAATRLVVSDGENEAVVERGDGGWTMPALGGFPADAEKVARLLDRLADLKRGWPVAQTRANAGRYKVAEDDFERRLTIEGADGPIAELFLGDAPTFKRVYARSGADADVYNIEFAAFDAPATVREWTDKNALAIDAAEVAEIRVADVVLANGEDGFALAGLGDEERARAAEVRGLADDALQLPFDEIAMGEEAAGGGGAPDEDGPLADEEEEADAAASAVLAPLEVRIVRKEGAPRVYTISPPTDDGGQYAVASSEHDQTFMVAKYRIASLLNASRDALTEMAAAQDTDPATEEDPATALAEPDAEASAAASTPPSSTPPSSTPSSADVAEPVASEATDAEAPPGAEPPVEEPPVEELSETPSAMAEGAAAAPPVSDERR